VIHESAQWKDELSLQIDELSRASGNLDPSLEYESIELERPVLYSALIARRLIECRKVTDAVASREYPIEEFLIHDGVQESLFFNIARSEIDRAFNIANPRGLKMNLKNLSSEIMHSGLALIKWRAVS
jgi:hypothetical protein